MEVAIDGDAEPFHSIGPRNGRDDGGALSSPNKTLLLTVRALCRIFHIESFPPSLPESLAFGREGNTVQTSGLNADCADGNFHSAFLGIHRACPVYPCEVFPTMYDPAAVGGASMETQDAEQVGGLNRVPAGVGSVFIDYWRDSVSHLVR